MNRDNFLKHLNQEDLLNIFGKTDLTLKEIFQYFSISWQKWKENQIILKTPLSIQMVEQIGFLNMVRNGKIYRFKRKEDLFLVKLMTEQ